MTCENLFVIFPPSLGGNHLANMLSLGKKYADRFDPASYDQDASVAHFSHINHLHTKSIQDNLHQLKHQSNVFCGHWAEYLLFQKSGLVKHFSNKKFFAIQMPEVGSLGYNRMIGRDPRSKNEHLFREITLLYRASNLSVLCDETTSPWYCVWPNMLFDPDISALFADLKNQGFDIDFDFDFVQSLHTKWFKRL